MRPRHEGVPKQKWEVACEEYTSPNLLDCNKQLLKIFDKLIDCNRQLSFEILWHFYSLASLHVDIICVITLFYVAHESEHRQLFNTLKSFLLQM